MGRQNKQIIGFRNFMKAHKMLRLCTSHSKCHPSI